MRFKLLLLFIIPLCLHAQPGYFEPWGKDAALLHIEEPCETEAPKSIFVKGAEKVIRFHQNILSPVDGPRSHFKPSSSEYMRLAMQKHGFVQGFFMGCDRLLRENDDKWVYRTIDVDGALFKYDPVP